MLISIFATPILSRLVFVSILALTLAACSTREVDSRNRGAGSADSKTADSGENQKLSQTDAKKKSEKSFLALTLPDSMPLAVTTVQVTLAKIEQPTPMAASTKTGSALTLTSQDGVKSGQTSKKCGTLVETKRGKDPSAPATPNSPKGLENPPVPKQPEAPVSLATPPARPLPALGEVNAVAPRPIIVPIFIVKCEPGSQMEICGGGSPHMGRPDVMPSPHGMPMDDYYASSGGWTSPLDTTDIWGTTSNSMNYSFPATNKEIKIDDLEVGTYQITIDLTDSKSGKVLEHGEGVVIIEAGKQAVAHIKMNPVPETTGSLLIVLDRSPVAVATTK